jgi:hypothetical protein
MPAGLRRVLPAAAAVFCIALALPVGALADGGGKCTASACKVYHEQDVPSAGRKQQPPPATGPSTNGGNTTHVPSKLSRVLQQAGRDRGPLKHLLTDAGIGNLQSGPASAASPSLLGAAFDLGTGPMVLLVLLLGTAVGLAARGSVRGWIRRRSSL